MPPLLLTTILGIALLVVGVREYGRWRRRRSFQEQSRGRLIEELTDPREVAAILLVQVAAYGTGQVTIAAKDKMTSLMTAHFECTPDEAEGFYSFGRMAVGQMNDAFNSLGRLLRPIHDRCTLNEMKALVGMMSEVAALEGPADPDARRLINETRTALHVDLPADQDS